MDNNNYKRQYRQLNNGLKKYWATVPNQPNNENKNEEHE